MRVAVLLYTYGFGDFKYKLWTVRKQNNLIDLFENTYVIINVTKCKISLCENKVYSSLIFMEYLQQIIHSTGKYFALLFFLGYNTKMMTEDAVAFLDSSVM